MFLIRIIYILISLSFMYSQTYFNRIIGGDVQFGDARSMGLANSYTTTGSTSSITSRNPARLSYLANGNKGISFDFQFNLQNSLSPEIPRTAASSSSLSIAAISVGQINVKSFG